METPFELPDDDVTVIAKAAEHGITTVPYRVEDYGSNKHRITKDIESLLCPICMDVWTNSGEHHIFVSLVGTYMACLASKNGFNTAEIPIRCEETVIAVDEESQKRIRSPEAKCAAFESKDIDWHKKEAEWQKREDALHLLVQKLRQEGKSEGQVAELLSQYPRRVDAFKERIAKSEHMAVEQRIAIIEQLMEAVMLWLGDFERRLRPHFE
ncbi:hypothetical protein JHK87_007709 [Glycine soja]|nr:hypothetical protein JHK87_007709 [Glycine soja]